jgi:polar amino acid transport system permease protein
LMNGVKIRALDVIIFLLILVLGLTVFLKTKAGLHYRWDWSAIPQYLFRYDAQSREWVPNVLMQGLFNTVRLSVWGTLLATFIGTVIGLFRLSDSLFKRLIGRTYVELIRNLPPLVIIFIFYFFIGDQIMSLLGVQDLVQAQSEKTQAFLTFLFAPPSLFPAFLSALLALGLLEAAYVAEIVRSGIGSIERGQWEASYALGLSRRQQLRHIILPQAVRRILPPLAGQMISTIKDSAIVSVISIQELTFQGMELMSSTYLTFEVWIAITALYLLFCLTLSVAVGRLENHLRRRET